MEKIVRKTLIKSINKGGLGIIDLQYRRKAEIITQFIKVPKYLNQPWTCLYVYWFGLMVKNIHPRLSDYTLVHTLNIPKTFVDIKSILLEKHSDTKILKMDTKFI